MGGVTQNLAIQENDFNSLGGRLYLMWEFLD